LLLSRENLFDRLRLRLDEVDRVDVAVAWASPGDALSRIHAFAKANPRQLRSIVGIHGNATHPAALKKLWQHGKLRIVPDDQPLFHPKLFLFHGAKRTITWIGSANLTGPGFEQNTELVWEFEDDGSATRWFRELWNRLDRDPFNIIEAYEKRWTPPSWPTRKSAAEGAEPSAHEFRRLAKTISDWSSFVRAVQTANTYWTRRLGLSADGETNSWLNTIRLGKEVVTRESWDVLSKVDYRLIMGIDQVVNAVEVGYGLLGSMRGAGDAKEVFNRSTPTTRRTREGIRRALQPAIHASSKDFSEAALEFIRTVNGVDGFSGGVATRLLTLARPDLAVSVNQASKQALAELTGLPTSSLNRARSKPGLKSYADLLRFFDRMPWYNAPSPRNVYERTLADVRAALFDCFIYRPKSKKPV
jgi:HKD family nuclease